MFGKLALRNVRRSARDYLVYVLTMTFVVSLMFAFNSIIFSKDLQKMYEMAAIMAAMIGIATFFIVLIVAWLINYMVRFMLEKRSREFGIYLLIGMNKKEVSGLYMKENLLLPIEKAGAATFQTDLERFAYQEKDALTEIDKRLSKRNYLLGDTVTEADKLLYQTLLRHDYIYYYLYKLNFAKSLILQILRGMKLS